MSDDINQPTNDQINHKQHFYCRLPWTGFSNDPDGKVRPCCIYKEHIKDAVTGEPMYVQKYSVSEIFQSEYMKDLRQQFRNGEKPAGCSTCWIDEANGLTSKRVMYEPNNHFTKRFGLDVDWDSEPNLPREYQMILSNSCNLKCRSCSPSHSSQWQAEFKAMHGQGINPGYAMPYKQAGDEDGKLWQNREEWYATLSRLEIVGGEPFYVKQWQQVFNELIESGRSKDIVVSMSTNCSLFYPDLVEKIAANFGQVGVGLSVDGIGPTFEYLRHGAKWDTVYANMRKYYEVTQRHKNFSISVSITNSWLNAFDLPKLHTLIQTEFPGFAIWNNIVHYPEHMALWAIPESLKDAIEDCWNKHGTYHGWGRYAHAIVGLITFMRSRSIIDNDFRHNLTEKFYPVDQYRNESLIEAVSLELQSFIRNLQ